MKNIVKGKIANALTSAAIDHVVAVTHDIYDEQLDMYQDDINQSKQDKLIDSTETEDPEKQNIKTINGESILGSGNLEIKGNEMSIENNIMKVIINGEEYSIDYYTKIEKPTLPIITPSETEQSGDVNITISGNGDIYYTTDGTTPTKQSNKYTGTFILYQDTSKEYITKTIKTFSEKLGQVSDIATITYNIYRKLSTPTITKSGDDYDTERIITINQIQSSDLYYTTNGSTPDKTSTFYSDSFTVNTNSTIKAIGIKDTWKDSNIGSLEVIVNKKKCYIGRMEDLTSNSDVENLQYKYKQDTLVRTNSYDIDFGTETFEYIWFCVPKSKIITNITSEGYEVKIESVKSVESYNCYRTQNKLNNKWKFIIK